MPATLGGLSGTMPTAEYSPTSANQFSMPSQASAPNVAALSQSLGAGAKLAMPTGGQPQQRTQARAIQLPAQQFASNTPTVITPGSADGDSLLALMQKYRA